MAADELGFSIKTDLGNALSKLGQIERAIKRIGSAKKESTKAAADLGGRMSQLSQALARAGGLFGELAGRLGGGAGMAGALGRVAVAAGLAAAAYRTLTAVSARAVENTRAQIRAERELADALRAGAQAKATAGAAARGQEDNLRRLTALGGSQADIDRVVQRYGVSAEDAGRALVATRSAGLGAGDEANALGVALLLSRTGRMGFGDAAAAFAGNRGAQAQAAGGAGAAAAATLATQAGQQVSAGQLVSESQRVRGSRDLAMFDELRGIEGQRDLAQLQALRETGVGSARADLARTRDPLTAALVELNQRREAEIATLARLADSQAALVAFLEDAKMMFGGEGSYEQQRRRALVNNAPAARLGG